MTTNSSRPELKFNRYDAVVAVIVALLAVAVALWFYLPEAQSGDVTVVISTGGQETQRAALKDFAGTTVSHNGYTLVVSADEDGVWVSDSDCPTQDCVRTGTISRSGQSIVCLPARIVIQLTGGAADSNDVDIVIG